MWDEMSYRRLTQSSKDTLPDFWDNIYSPSEEMFAAWVYEDGTYVFGMKQE